MSEEIKKLSEEIPDLQQQAKEYNYAHAQVGSVSGISLQYGYSSLYNDHFWYTTRWSATETEYSPPCETPEEALKYFS